VQTGEVVRVEVVHPRCAGIDVSKKDSKVCVQVQGSGRRATKATVTTWGAMSNEILALREYLIAEEVTCVVMESTGDYWKPFYYLLEDAVNVMAGQPAQPPGPQDVSDAAWLAELGAHGLLRASLVPPPPIRRLRDLTRARTDLTRDRAPDPPPREDPGGRRHQTVLGRDRHRGAVGPGDAGSADRGQGRSGGNGRSGETPDAVEDLHPDRGVDGAVHARLEDRWPTLRLIHLPVHASWLNQVEIYFSVVQRKVVSPNDFHFLSAVESRLLDFQQHYEQIATPFEWKFTKNDLNALLERIAAHDHADRTLAA
jgi:hypothetical protein